MYRRGFLGTLAFAASRCLSNPEDRNGASDTDTDADRGGGDGGNAGDGGGVAVSFESYSEGYRAPLAMAAGGGEVFVADKVGKLYRVTDGGKETVLDIGDRLVDSRGEKGLLGVALHPSFADNGKMYLRYSTPLRGGMPGSYSHTFALSEFRYRGGEVEKDTEVNILEVPEPQGNHNSGNIVFGPDGYLYVGVGDGGAGGDRGNGHVDDWYDANPGGNGQDIDKNLLGGILRIDVDGERDSKNYAIPDTNPLADKPGLNEYYAWGLRNPWGMSFNEVDGDEKLFVADVGQNSYEEIDIVESGGNYGWNVREGKHCYGATPCPTETPEGEPLIDPVVEYSHQVGFSVIGGYVYRGGSLDGEYVFGDLNGKIFAAKKDGGDWSMRTLNKGRGAPTRILGFGRVKDDVYVLGNFEDGSGKIKEIEA